MRARDPAIRVLMMPKDTNGYGTIFGGVILSHIDLASAVEAHRVAAHRYVTRAMNAVEFHQPVLVGDLVSFYTEVTRIGNTSVTVRVVVEAQRWGALDCLGHPLVACLHADTRRKIPSFEEEGEG